ncbi:SDR family oxidoreductase [Paralcaligenes sp. KSB-10]|jgi:gluconate 5-dehydrogenase|uniref:SDR family oxidoreductase n=1 Tax=Paralcaligenes sp. KSB-10 TaxID=2901142 RepID=UPI001E32C209|nr:SDR family oxidoreductase [Paralcaligenes sp. KSB-10]UHL64746.1 SDR family oxidoreductase [Paralcaligenes sp. KSB-10]
MTNLGDLPDFSLNNRLALVTGSTQGLGLVIAKAYAASGARVVINGRNPDHVARAVAALSSQGCLAYPFVHDIARLDTQEAAYAQLCAQIGVPDILVNNVGIRIRKTLGEASLAEIVELVNVDLIAGVHLSKLAAQAMAKSAAAGRIITMTSIAGELARAGDAIYPIAKQGLSGMVRALAVEYGPKAITSNGIAPGTFATEANAQLVDDPLKSKRVVGRNPLGRWGRPSEIAGAAVFLASPAASYVNGHILVVDGGFSITF